MSFTINLDEVDVDRAIGEAAEALAGDTAPLPPPPCEGGRRAPLGSLGR